LANRASDFLEGAKRKEPNREGAPLQTQERSSTLAKGRVSPIDRESILSADLVDITCFRYLKMENAKEDNAESRQWIRDNAPDLMSLGLQGFALHGKGAVFADPFRKYNPCYVPAWLLPPHQGTKTAVEKYSKVKS
jgi:hypothetical protein